MSVNVYKMKCVTNLHVGSGDENYNIIDNEVERDPVTGYPTINSSGVKGALREHFRYVDSVNHIEIFGQDNKDKSSRIKSGSYKFFSADFLSRPLRVSDNSGHTYINVTTVDAIESFLEKMELLNVDFTAEWEEVDFDGKEFLVSGESKISEIEGKTVGKTDANKALLENLIGRNYAIAKSLNEYELPVMARNFLENGESKNLWYEEIVPHESMFYTVIITPDGVDCEFDSEFEKNTIQFGGNASIGYGVIKLEKI